MATVTLDHRAINFVINDPLQPIQRHLRSIAVETRRQVPRFVRSNTGAIERSTKESFNKGSGLVGISASYWTVETDVSHAMSQHEGAKPHIIKPRRRAALYFFWPKIGTHVLVPKGPIRATYFHRRRALLVIGKGRIDHPGNPATQFLLRALMAAMRRAGGMGGP